MPTKIEWCDETWNPITGCTPVSPGCDHCYARRMATRLAGRFGYPADEPFRVTFHRDRLDEPQRWRKPRRVFVCSMGDLWHPDVDPCDRAAVIRATNLAPQHTYLFLTKRPQNVKEDFSGCPNFWIGATVENQEQIKARDLAIMNLQTRVRFLSCEPLLGPLDVRQMFNRYWRCNSCGEAWDYHAGDDDEEGNECRVCQAGVYGPLQYTIHWVIVGGETGPKARPLHPGWVRSIRDQCQAAGVPFFYKHAGEWIPQSEVNELYDDVEGWPTCEIEGEQMIRVGKKFAGRLLDGQEWNEFPISAEAAGGKSND